MRGVERVDERVHAGAVGTGGDRGRELRGGLAARGEVSAVTVEVEVAVSRVVRVDEGVEVGVDWGVFVVVVEELGDREGGRGLTDWESLLRNSLLYGSWSEWSWLLGGDWSN